MFSEFWIILVFTCSWSTTLDGPIVRTPLGAAIGWQRTSRSGRIYNAWTKLPYAEPPLGKLRLRPPKPARKWLGLRDATVDIPYCIQDLGASPAEGNFSTSEDCLYLNVYRPKDPINTPMPVLLYLYGGMNLKGYIGRRWNADYLMDEDVILVEPGFRLNSFGFLSLGDDVLPGNIGYKDQAMVLKWINKYIHAFDGDPSRVIAFGESSGAAASHFLINSPLTKDLVSGAVSHSGVINHSETLPMDDRTRTTSINIIDRVGCNRKSSKEILNCLQDLDAYDLFDATREETGDPIHMTMTAVLEPKSVNGAFITEDPSLNPSDKPWIVTFANGELTVNEITMRSVPQYPKTASENITEYVENWLREQMQMNSSIVSEKAALIVNKYFSKPMPISKFTFTLAKMTSDYNFFYGTVYNILKHKGPKWIAQIEYKGDQVTRFAYPYNLAGHASNTDFIFNRTGPYPWSSQESYRDYTVSKRFISYLVNFAYYGNPTPLSSPYRWKQFRTNEVLRMTGSGDLLGDGRFLEELFRKYIFWNDIIGW